MELKQKGISEQLAKEKVDCLAEDKINVIEVAKKYLKNKYIMLYYTRMEWLQ